MSIALDALGRHTPPTGASQAVQSEAQRNQATMAVSDPIKRL